MAGRRAEKEEDSGAQIRAADVTLDDYLETALSVSAGRRPDIDPESQALSILLSRMAFTHVNNAESLVHHRFEWTWQAFRLLFMVWLFEPVEARDLQRLSGLTRQSISSVMSSMEARGVVRRERTSTSDRRLVEIRLTDQGAELVQQAMVGQNQMMKRWLSALTPAERATLRELLTKLLAASVDLAD